MNSNIAATAGARFLHSPGPSHVPDVVLNAMSAQPMDLGDPRLARLIDNCEWGLRELLGSRNADVLMYAANGHGAWEATIVNLLAPGSSVLIAGTGHFSESWALHAETCGAVVVRTPTREGCPIDAHAIEAALRADSDREIVAVFAVHTDTASGVTSDIQAIRHAIDRAGHPAIFVVDVVASLAATPFLMEEWGVNVAIGASQKALMVPPGLSFTAVDAKAMAAAAKNPTPRVYWDWERRKSDLLYRKFCGTPPETLLMGLEAALAQIAREGLEAVFARHWRISRAVHAAVERWSEAGAVWLFAKSAESRATSVTSVAVRQDVDPGALCGIARERFFVALAGGLGPHAGRMFRIGHLGDIN
jgi:alanine-glyoxylate transaminase/serine-glyoxylate transaminase/serine-pyruvate transaminase